MLPSNWLRHASVSCAKPTTTTTKPRAVCKLGVSGYFHFAPLLSNAADDTDELSVFNLWSVGHVNQQPCLSARNAIRKSTLVSAYFYTINFVWYCKAYTNWGSTPVCHKTVCNTGYECVAKPAVVVVSCQPLSPVNSRVNSSVNKLVQRWCNRQFLDTHRQWSRWTAVWRSCCEQ